MVIVGYDDAKNAYLVQNSWGMQWGQRVYCWIAYDLFNTIIHEDIDANGNPVFCNWAVTLVDVEEPIEFGPDGMARPLDFNTLRISGFSDFIRYERVFGRFLYGFSVELHGQRDALEGIDFVTWNWINPLGEEQSLEVRNADALFGIRSSTTLNPLTVHAECASRTAPRALTHEVLGPTPVADDFREAEIIFDHWFYDMIQDTHEPLYMWQVSLDYPLNERDDIVKATWDWGQMSNYDTTSVTYEGTHEGVIADKRPTGFATPANGGDLLPVQR